MAAVGAVGMTPLARLLAAAIAAHGPMPVAQWMALCLGHPQHGYYATRDPLGSGGDFTTAPEISQVFGELIGAALADQWLRAGAPPHVRLVELGPGRGTLMADLLRATARIAGFAAAAHVHFVETSPVLRAAQAVRVPHAHWHDQLSAVPADAPLLLVANEFFDALPVRQFERAADGWRERMVDFDGNRFHASLGSTDATLLAPLPLRDACRGSVVEISPTGMAVAAEIGLRLHEHGGAALIFDYGHAGPAIGDTLQAVRGHAYADPLEAPGEADITAHVDFSALAAAAGGVTATGLRGQGQWLTAMGIDARVTALGARATPVQATALRSGAARLTGDMGTLFKVLGLTAPGWPEPAGFA